MNTIYTEVFSAPRDGLSAVSKPSGAQDKKASAAFAERCDLAAGCAKGGYKLLSQTVFVEACFDYASVFLKKKFKGDLKGLSYDWQQPSPLADIEKNFKALIKDGFKIHNPFWETTSGSYNQPVMDGLQVLSHIVGKESLKNNNTESRDIADAALLFLLSFCGKEKLVDAFEARISNKYLDSEGDLGSDYANEALALVKSLGSYSSKNFSDAFENTLAKHAELDAIERADLPKKEQSKDWRIGR